MTRKHTSLRISIAINLEDLAKEDKSYRKTDLVCTEQIRQRGFKALLKQVCMLSGSCSDGCNYFEFASEN